MHTHQIPVRFALGPQRCAGLLARMSTALRQGMQRSRQRAHLLELDEAERRDVGITLEQARHEAEKPFWR